MKRLLAVTLMVGLLLCGCRAASSAPTEPAEPEKVTVYLLEKVRLYDNGHTEYFYDEHYNIDTYKVVTIEETLMYIAYFEEKDSNGMPGKYRQVWDSDSDDYSMLTWRQDGKLLKEVYGTDTEYHYDAEGKLVKKQEYYEGILDTTVHYEYDGNVLQQAYCINEDNHMNYEYRIENGRIVEKICYDEEGSAIRTYHLKYDKNGNLEQKIMHYAGELVSVESYTYRAVEVDASRAPYLIEQQKYLLSLI